MKDEKWLKSQFPFPLIPTNMEGVYTSPSLPDDLDLKTASDATLWQHGLLLQRPKPGAHPTSVAAWNKVCERGLRTIVPELAPLPEARRRKRRPRPRTGGGGGQAILSNWCGGVLDAPASSNWRSVYGTLSRSEE